MLGAPVPRFKRRGLKRRTARALHGLPMGRGPATVFFFFADFFSVSVLLFKISTKNFNSRKILNYNKFKIW
jgi:hypothetical protein